MKLPYGYVLNDEEIVIHEEWADVVCRIFEYYLAGASLGKFVDMLFIKRQEIISAVQRENTAVWGLLHTKCVFISVTPPWKA